MGYEEERDRSGHRRSRRAKPSEMEDDGLTLITDSFAERREDGSHRSGDRSRSGQKAAKRGQTQPGSSRESRNQEKARTMNRSDIYADPAKLKARRKKKRKIWFILLEIAVLIGILCFAGYSYINSRLDLMQRLPWNPDEIKNVEISEEKQEQMSGYWTIAVFGVDSRNSSVGKGNNSDVNILCNIDQGTGEIRLVSVYRDSYLNINDKNTYNKINAAYMQGGPEQVVKALNRNLDIDIDDYATFNWKAVADAINILGGIDVEITKSEFYYINAFISETVKATGVASTQLKSAGMNHLDGVQAVAYGRLRLMDTDYARTERQRKVISLAFEKMKKADWATINNIVQTVFPQVATSIEINDLLKIGRNITRYHLTETTGFPSELKEKKMGRKGACVIPQTLESNVISCLAMRNTRRLRRSGRSVRKLYQIQAFMARNRQKRRHCRRRPRRRQFPSWIRRRRAARTKARKPGAAATSPRKRPVMLRKHRRMTFLSRKAVRTVRMHQRKMRGRAVRQSLAVLRRHFRAEILAPARRRMAEKNLPAAVLRMEAVHREVRRMRESSLSDERV